MIKKSSTRYTAKTAFQSIEAKIARWWLNPTSNHKQMPGEQLPYAPIDQGSNDAGDESPTHPPFRGYRDEVEEAALNSVEQLGFMLRAPLTAIASIAWAFGTPIWALMTKSHTYHLPMAVLQQHYKDELVTPWLEGLNEEGEASLIGVIHLTSREVRAIVNGELEKENVRYSKRSETLKSLDKVTVENLVMASVNLLAAEEALQELQKKMSPG